MGKESRRPYDVQLVGCDASTTVTIHLTAAEALLISDLADKTSAACGDCSPWMEFRPHLPPQQEWETGAQYAARIAALDAVEPGWTLT